MSQETRKGTRASLREEARRAKTVSKADFGQSAERIWTSFWKEPVIKA